MENMAELALDALMQENTTTFCYHLPPRCSKDVETALASKTVAASLKTILHTNDYHHDILVYDKECNAKKHIIAKFTFNEGIITMSMKPDMKLKDTVGTLNILENFVATYMPAVNKVETSMKNDTPMLSRNLYIEEVFDVWNIDR